MTDWLIGFAIIAGIIALFFVADWVWAGRLKKKLQTDPSKRPATYDPTADSSTNYGATSHQATRGNPGGGTGYGA